MSQFISNSYIFAIRYVSRVHIQKRTYTQAFHTQIWIDAKRSQANRQAGKCIWCIQYSLKTLFDVLLTGPSDTERISGEPLVEGEKHSTDNASKFIGILPKIT